MAYHPIENYGIIGNMRTAALVNLNGSIDWYCYPHFDSPSVFAAILDDGKGGRFEIAAVEDGVATRQLYWPETNVLVTRLYSASGVGEIQDFMPVSLPQDSPWQNQLIRRVRVTQGSMKLRVLCHPAFDYARAPYQTRTTNLGASFR
jgi:GH15 family glucan-1,4-alpha-glucosidase